MWLTIIGTFVGVVLGAISSWAITHAYYRIAQQKAVNENPLALFSQVSSELEAIKNTLGDKLPGESSLISVLQRTQTKVNHTKYIFRSALQSWFSEFTALRIMAQNKDSEAVVKQIAKMDQMMKTMSRELHHVSSVNISK